MPKSRTDLWISLALLIATLATYFSVRTFDFVNYDDPDYVTQNAHVRDGLDANGVFWALTTTEAANWFPVTRISHLIDYQAFGFDSGAHHLTSVVLHVCASLILFGFLFSATGSRWPSAFVAFVFALHPMHVESVAWVSERKDVLCALFWFLTLWAWLRYIARPGWRRYLLVLAAFCLGLMSKPMIVTLPFVLLLLDLWPLKRPPAIREKLPLFALSAVSAIITFAVQRSSGAVETIAAVPLLLRLENAATTYLLYVAKAFWPSGLAVFYPYPAAIPLWQSALATLAILGVTVVVTTRIRKAPYLAVGWFWYLGTLVPVIGLVQVGSQSRADRYLYVPMVGLTVMLAWGASDLVRRWPRVRVAIVALGGVACAACLPLTVAQAAHWKNSETLFTHAVEVTDENSLAEHNLGSYLLDAPGRLTEATAHLQAAARITPNSASIHSDLGTAFAKSSRTAEAIAEYQTALRLKPDSAIVHNNLGNALRESGRLPEAVAEYQTALRLDPNYTDARKNLSDAQSAPAPDSPEAHYSAGIDLAHSGRVAEAIAQFQAALGIRPDYAEAENNLGVALTQVPGRESEALAHFQKAARLKPDYGDARFNLGVALSQVPGRMPEAIRELEAAYRLHPDPELRRTIDRLR